MALKTQASAALRLAAKRKQLSRSAPGLMHVRTHSTSSAVSPATMANVLNLAGNLKSAADVESLVLTYGVKNAHIPGTVRPLAVVKVGGEVITKDIDNLVTSLKFLKDFGLFPVVVHGGGPQLNDELAKAGVKPEYIGGHRVTDPATMAVAKRVFEGANGELAAALRKAGMPTQQLLGGIFGAEVADGSKLGLVGEIKKVFADEVNKAIAEGKVPVLTSLGLSSTGQVLNINADVAARELAISLQPLKVVFISAGGGWKEDGKVISNLDMAQDYERMVNRDYTGRQGTLLKLKEMKQIVDNLPAVSSVTIASASALASQLLPHAGPGTQIRSGSKINHFHSVGATDHVKLESLLSACGDAEGVALMKSPNGISGDAAVGTIAAVFATHDYSAAAIVTQSAAADAVPVLRSLVCSPVAMAEGVEAALWAVLQEKFPSLTWTAKASRDTKEAAAEVQAKGPSHIPFAFPPLSVNRAARYATITIARANGDVAMGFGAGAAAVVAASSLSAPVTVTSTASSSSGNGSSSKSSGKGLRVGLLGARGYVGRELLKLLAIHPDMTVVCASSRALVGQSVPEGLGVPEAAAACAPGLTFSDVGPDQLKNGNHPAVDAWVLALPNGLAAPHADAIEARAKSTSSPMPLLIDLSADMRFDGTGAWTYGLPERPGAREKLRGARKISNPGCYATGAQTALMPLLKQYRGAADFFWDPSVKPHVFGISGYSGAGTNPGPNNDPNRLRDNILPYSLVNHIHEREVGHHCGQPIAFMPHVAPFFQGISLTVTGHLLPKAGASAASFAAITPASIREAYTAFYGNERLIKVLAGEKEMPNVRMNGTFYHGVTVGGFTYDPKTGRLALVSCIDNLLKGAATQAVQNMNLALGLDEYAGIPMQ